MWFMFTFRSNLSNKNGHIRYARTHVYVLTCLFPPYSNSWQLLQTHGEGVLKRFYLHFPFFSATKLIIWINHSVIIAWGWGWIVRSIYLLAFPPSLYILFVPCHSLLQIVHVPTPPAVTRYCLWAFQLLPRQSWTVSELKASEIHETQFPLYAPLWNYNGTYVYVQ
jgi:hypothetical protein